MSDDLNKVNNQTVGPNGPVTEEQKLKYIQSVLASHKAVRESSEPVIDLANPSSVDVIRRTVEVLEHDRMASDAREFVTRMTSRLGGDRSIPQNLVDVYMDFSLRAKFVCLAILSNEEVIDVFQKSLLQYLRLPIEHVEIIEQLRKKIVGAVWPPDLELFLRQLVQALEKNTEKQSANQLVIPNEESRSPVIRNWIYDYIIFKGRRKEGMRDGGALERVSYINESSNVRQLNKNERDQLLRILEIYDWIKSGGPFAEREKTENVYMKKERIVMSPEPKVSVSTASLPPKVLPPPPWPPQAGIRKQELGIREEKKEPPPPSPGNNPPQSPLTLRGEEGGLGRGGGIKGAEGEKGRQELYRKTLEELRKMREGESTLRKSEIPSPPPNLPHQGGGMKGKERVGGGEGQAVGVNEALISAATKQSPQDRGSVVPGEKEVEEKLRKLEEKLK